MPTRRFETTARLRARNQLTLPARIADTLGARPYDRLVFEADPARPATVIVRRVPRSFAGALTGVYGSTRDVQAYLREEHEAWGTPVRRSPGMR